MKLFPRIHQEPSPFFLTYNFHKPQSSDENIADEKSNEIYKINSGKPVNRVIKMVELRAKPYCAWSMR